MFTLFFHERAMCSLDLKVTIIITVIISSSLLFLMAHFLPYALLHVHRHLPLLIHTLSSTIYLLMNNNFKRLLLLTK